MVNSFIARRDLDTEMTVVRATRWSAGERSAAHHVAARRHGRTVRLAQLRQVTIGARSDVENVDIPRLQAFYRNYYQPDNATLVVSGRFDPQQVLGWVQDAFGKIPAPKRKLPTLYTLEPVQDGERTYTVRRSGGVPMLLASYHAPAASHPDYAAIEVLASILLDEPSGRLYQQLVEGPGGIGLGLRLGPGRSGGDDVRCQLLRRARTSTRRARRCSRDARGLCREADRRRGGRAREEALAQRVGAALHQPGDGRRGPLGRRRPGDWRLFFLLRDRVRAVTAADAHASRRASSSRPTSSSAPARPTEAQCAPCARASRRRRRAQGLPGRSGGAAGRASRPRRRTSTRARSASTGLRNEGRPLPKGTRGQAVEAVLSMRYGDEEPVRQRRRGRLHRALLDRGTSRMSRQQIQDRFGR